MADENQNINENLYLAGNGKRIIGIRDTSMSMTIAVGLGVIFYFLYCVLVGCIALTIHFLLMENFIAVTFIGAFVILLTITLTQEKKELFLRISYPREGIIRVNLEDLDYKNNDTRILFVGIQSPINISKYDYFLQILQKGNTVYSARINYVRQNKIRKFINNIIFEEDIEKINQKKRQ